MLQKTGFIVLLLFLSGFSHLKALASTSQTNWQVWLQAHDGYSDLNVPWEFYWQRLLTPRDELPTAPSLLEMGRYWNDFVQRSGTKTPVVGFATYRLVLRDLEPTGEGYSIVFKHTGSAFRAFAYPDGKPELAQEVRSGKVGQSFYETQPSRDWRTLRFQPTQKENWVILVQTSNFHLPFGGIRYAPTLAIGTAYLKSQAVQQVGSFVCIGIMLSIAFYSFMMFWRRREDESSLFLCGVAILVALRTLILNPLICDLFPESLAVYKLQWWNEYLVASPAIGLFMFLLSHSLSIPLSHYVKISSVVLNAVCTILVLNGSLMIYLQNRSFLFLSIFLHIAMCLVIGFKAVFVKRDGIVLWFWSAMIPCLAIFHDALVGLNYISHPPLLQYGFAAFLIAQSQLVAKRSAMAFAQTKVLAENLHEKNDQITAFNTNLETLIRNKTQEIKSILNHVPQGVLIVGKDGLVSSEYSAKLPVILEETCIAHRTLVDLIFAQAKQTADANPSNHLTLSSDDIDRVIQALKVSIGEDVINFELNRSNFPDVIEYSAKSGRNKILEVTWDPVPDTDEVVQEIIITLLDVTETRRLQRELEEQQHGLRLIKELIDCGEKKSASFFVTVEPLIHENMRLINDNLTINDSSTIKILFVNLHTAKGAARTLGLSKLATIIHEAEQYNSELIKNTADFSLERLRSDIENVKNCFEKYLRSNREDLGRNFDVNVVPVSRQFLADQLAILSGFHRCSLTQDQKVHSTIIQSIDQISSLIFSDLLCVLENSFAQIARIAKDLGKLPPDVYVRGNSIAIPKDTEILIEKVAVHIARNIMDHGIESTEERIKQGKTPSGSITITTEPHSGRICIIISDDGRGLAVGKLREKLSRRSPQLAAGADAAVIAETVFDVGVSTAETISQISGRGVGMEAVRKYIEDAGGRIHLMLHEQIPTPGEYYRFSTVIELKAFDSPEIHAVESTNCFLDAS